MGQDQINHNEILDRLRAVEENQKEMATNQKEIAQILKPMNESYQAAIRIGKWVSGFLIFVSIAVGIILSIKDLFTKK